jgi:hypothetical protein
MSLKSAEGKAMIKQLFSDANVKKAGIKINAAYMSCPKAEPQMDHKGLLRRGSRQPRSDYEFF